LNGKWEGRWGDETGEEELVFKERLVVGGGSLIYNKALMELHVTLKSDKRCTREIVLSRGGGF